MSLKLTKEILAACYESLRACPPIRGWKLPPASVIRFSVSRSKSEQGHYTRYVRSQEHFISISGAVIGRYHALAEVMAHEMIHLAQAIRKEETAGAQHNADFKRKAARVCRLLGFDPHLFC
jgi:hypothetical protein